MVAGCGAAKRTADTSAPIIGVSAGGVGQSRVVDAYIDAVKKAGGVPVIIPIITDRATLAAVLDKVDGVMVTGGEDIDPHYFGEEPIPELGEVNAPRDVFDLLLCQMAYEAKKPILAICRGMQVMNVAFGGSLWQDIPSQLPGSALVHRGDDGETPTHKLVFAPASHIELIVGEGVHKVNSFHHQAVKQVAAGFTVTSKTEDGIIESFERFDKGDRIIGVQFHPEKMLAEGDKSFLPLFKWLVDESKK